VRNLQVFAPIEYQLKELLKVDMTGIIHLNIDTPNGASQITVDGDLMLQQDSPIIFD
jgi:hypothetical protein